MPRARRKPPKKREHFSPVPDSRAKAGIEIGELPEVNLGEALEADRNVTEEIGEQFFYPQIVFQYDIDARVGRDRTQARPERIAGETRARRR